ncbi:MAG: ATP-dependent zinc metalloprotease FtsH [Candidatus Shapirobacteria bacterium]|nr:ATP-dependent zinc metalloprotease FtsH [Candidatus Shapirobacteria bacterium]MDD4410192.1 ATP-dependent zinc metalloprotease FtsH [Candidatus Shapirobacteria bacterium]
MKIFEDLKKKLGLDKNKTEAKKTEKKNAIPKELLDKLPPGVKIKRIEIGPKQIVKLVIYLILGYWILSTLVQVLLPKTVSSVSISEVITAAKKDEVSKIVVADNQIMATLKSGDKIMVASKETSISMTEILQKEGVDLSKISLQIENRTGWKMVGEILTLFLSFGLPILFILWLFKKQSGGAGGGVFGFGKSTAKLFIKGKQSLTFKDVAGVEEAKNDLVEVVDFLKHPEKYHKMGARAPKGVLLVGPSGVGKTLLAKAVAGEAGVPFYSMAGSEFMEMLVGVGASRVRDLFGTAKKAGKAIIFIDEIDAIGRIRGGMDGGHGEREQTLNQILVEMDGFEANTAVVVLAATNRGDLLDPALLRPGRFDRRVVLELPDLEARKEILKIHARGKPFDEDVNWDLVAKSTVGFSGAELENMLNEAAIGAARFNKTKINMKDIDDASLKVKLGAEKKRSQSDEDKLMTAYHEAGHAIVNYVEELDPVSKISIISRGSALGFTLVPPQKDVIHYTKSKLIKQMAMAMGGRAAEELIFNDITTGASSDISNATNMARNMVVEWGMSELGPINLGPQIDIGDWGKAYMEPAKISDNMQEKVDEEIKKFVDTAFTEAKKVLKENKIKLEAVAKALMEKESLNQEEFEEILK